MPSNIWLERVLTVLSVALLQGCVAPLPAPMQLCNDRKFDRPVHADVLETALAKATQWSTQAYGADCALCAELYDDDARTFTLHITSPMKNDFINTSATMTFSRSTARTLETAKYHSCHARYFLSRNGS
jgi:hypothetical protein